MEYLVIAKLEIEGEGIDYYTSISLSQKFNEHHQFIIRINHDVLEASNSSGLNKAKENIGKTALIRLEQLNNSTETAYEFKGIITEVRLEQSGNSNPDIVLIGYSPTILLDNNEHFRSFNKKDLKKIVGQVSNSLESYCGINIEPRYSKEILYIAQYRESNFHFLNRLSSEFSEFFYYDGKKVYFGKMAPPKNVEVTFGEDLSALQMTLQALPVKFTNYSYNSVDNRVNSANAPTNIDGLGLYGAFLLKKSNSLFSEEVISPSRQRVTNQNELTDFVKQKKANLSAGLEVLSGKSYNPNISIGCTINVKVSRLEDKKFVLDDYGKFIVTSINHYIIGHGEYYNDFVAVPSGIESIPVNNFIMPLAENQIATVTDNNDPENFGRVRVKMLWQKDSQVTDWIRVMTPDAGTGKGSSKNRGLVTIPEVGDQVLIGFRYNDPDRPFVMGGMFHGKSGEGGGKDNKNKSFSTLSGSKIAFTGDQVTITDADKKSSLDFDGKGVVTIESQEKIILKCGQGTITMEKDGKITIKGSEIIIEAQKSAIMKESGGASFSASSGKAAIEGITVEANSKASTKIGSSAVTEVTAGANMTIKGAIVMIN